MLRPSDDLYTLVFELQYTWPDWLAAARTAVKVEMASQYDSWYEFAQSSEGTGPLDARTFRDFLEFYIKHLNRLTHPGKQG